MAVQSAGMWELIERNRRQSAALVLVMGLVLMAMGAVIGYSICFTPQSATIGAAIAFVIFVIITFVAFSSGDKAVLAISNAKEVSHKEHPQLWNVTEEMSIAAGIPMPKLYLIDSDVPNAFATGRPPRKTVIAVTRGLMEKLSRDELQGVIAHEMSHIRHHDTTYMTVVVVMLGTILLLADLYLRAVWYGGSGRRRRSSGKGSGGAHLVLLVVAIVLAIVAPVIARLLYFAISRRREYLADAGAVELTRYPDGLAGALEKIASSTGKLDAANRATAHLYIVNPLKPAEARYSRWNSTHPPLVERVAILRSIAGSTGLAAYNTAFEHVTSKSGRYLVQRAAESLSGKKARSIRGKQQEKTLEEKKALDEKREKQFIGMVAAGMFLTCTSCNSRIDLTGENPEDKIVECAACGQIMPFPGADALTALAAGTLLTGGAPAPAHSKSAPPPGMPRVDGKALLGEGPTEKPAPDPLEEHKEKETESSVLDKEGQSEPPKDKEAENQSRTTSSDDN